MSAKHCNDPDSCNYSDCPTAFCDREKPSELASLPCSDDERLCGVIAELRRLHANAESIAFDEGVSGASIVMEAFNVSAWNNVPYILDALEHARKWMALLADLAERAQRDRNRLWDVSEKGAHAIDWTLHQLLLTDSVHIIRDAKLVDALHQSLGALRRALETKNDNEQDQKTPAEA